MSFLNNLGTRQPDLSFELHDAPLHLQQSSVGSQRVAL